jgi:hypothetical protein
VRDSGDAMHPVLPGRGAGDGHCNVPASVKRRVKMCEIINNNNTKYAKNTRCGALESGGGGAAYCSTVPSPKLRVGQALPATEVRNGGAGGRGG